MPPIESSAGCAPSSETATSSSVIAEAIQSASRCETRPERAVTRPPPPRRTARCLAASSSNCAGPRLETMISGSESAIPFQPTPSAAALCLQIAEQLQPVAQEAWREELLAGVFLARPPEALPQFGIAEDLERAP